MLCIRNLSPKHIAAFGQNQFTPQYLPSSCSSFSFAIIINLLLGRIITSGHEIDRYLVKHGYKSPWFGIPSFQLRHALSGLSRFLAENEIHFPYQMAYHSYKHIDSLTDNLKKDVPTIVEVSWGSTGAVFRALFTKGQASAVGHFMVLAGYDFKANGFSFLDPGNGGLTRYSKNAFINIWLQQPNLFIKAGSAVTFSSLPGLTGI